MLSPKVSIVVPTYNRADFLPKAIQSVLNQTYRDWEMIIVDDGSTDNTEEVVKGYKEERIRYIVHKYNLGLSAARNTGIKNSRGKYIALLDSDDEWFPEKISCQINIFQKRDSEFKGILVYPFCLKYFFCLLLSLFGFFFYSFCIEKKRFIIRKLKALMDRLLNFKYD